MSKNFHIVHLYLHQNTKVLFLHTASDCRGRIRRKRSITIDEWLLNTVGPCVVWGIRRVARIELIYGVSNMYLSYLFLFFHRHYGVSQFVVINETKLAFQESPFFIMDNSCIYTAELQCHNQIDRFGTVIGKGREHCVTNYLCSLFINL
jgi:hypothetical protein